jgi:hypothetical protein
MFVSRRRTGILFVGALLAITLVVTAAIPICILGSGGLVQTTTSGLS